MSAYSDEQLVLEALGDSQQAFAELVEQYQHRVLRTIASIISDEQAAQDMAQETFLSAWSNLAKLKERHKFGRWLNQIAISYSKRWLRDQRKHLANTVALEENSAILMEERNYQREKLRQEVWDAIDELAAEHKEAVILHYISGYSYKEISEMLAVPFSTIVGRIQQARNQLRKEFLDMVTQLQLEIDSTVHEFLKEHAKQDGVSVEGLIIRLIERYRRDIDSPEMAVRKVWNKRMWCGRPSPDGRYFSFVNLDNGNLAVRDLVTGESRNITDDATWDGAQSHAMQSAWSPDGRQIACWWSGGGHTGLRIIGIDGSQPRDLYNCANRPLGPGIDGCYDWSRDGKYILVTLSTKTDEKKWMREIALISVADGSVRTLKSPVPNLFVYPGISLSPDGRYVAYEREVKEHDDLRDIFLLATDGSGEETRLTDHPADDYRPVWASDQAIVFVSNRDPGSATGLWLMKVIDGKPMGEPQLVKREIGDLFPRGFTQKGSMFYTTSAHWSHIYVASLDMEAGKILASPALLRSDGDNMSPAWSPDGKSLAYTSDRTPPGSYRRKPFLVIRSMETGEERKIIPVPGLMGHPTCQLRWSPDGESIVCEHTSWPLRLIDVETGNLTTIPKTDSRVHGCAWSPNGKTIYYIGVDVSKEVGDLPRRIVAYELATHEHRELYMGVSDRSLAISPDGQHLAFLQWPGLKMLPTAGGEPRTIVEFHGESDGTETKVFPLTWTPDGHHLLFQKAKVSPDGSYWEHELWRIPAEGGEPQKVLDLKSYPDDSILSLFSLHPEGQSIAFARGKYYSQIDLWVMDNLLTTFANDK